MTRDLEYLQIGEAPAELFNLPSNIEEIKSLSEFMNEQKARRPSYIPLQDSPVAEPLGTGVAPSPEPVP